MRAFEAVARALREAGVDTIFGLMGDANIQHVFEFTETYGGRFIGSVDEGGAVSMAHGYARASGKVGIASVTHGPAVSNTLTSLVEACRAGSPLILITGDIPPTRHFFQELDLHGFASLAGAEYRRVLRPEHVVEDVIRAIEYTTATSQPILLDIPIQIQLAEVDYVGRKVTPPRQHAVAPDPDELDAALGVIAHAQRPVILAGRGAAISGARDDLVALADALGAVLGTTLQGKDLFVDHPYNLGIVGTLAHDAALAALQRADCIVAFGAGLNFLTTVDDGLLNGKAVVRCDTSPAQLLRQGPAGVQVVGDAGTIARAMLAELVGAGIEATSFRTEALASELSEARQPAELPGGADPSGSIDLFDAVAMLDRLLPSQRLMVTDSGRFTRGPWRYFHVPDPLKFVYTTTFGSIGLGTATAVGAAVAFPDDLTVGFVGDGGGMMGLIEFTTAVRNNIPLALIVMNDGSYGAEHTKLLGLAMDPAYSLIPWPEFADMAIAMGGRGVAVRTLDELEDAVKEISAEATPILIDVKLDPAAVYRRVAKA